MWSVDVSKLDGEEADAIPFRDQHVRWFLANEPLCIQLSIFLPILTCGLSRTNEAYCRHDSAWLLFHCFARAKAAGLDLVELREKANRAVRKAVCVKTDIVQFNRGVLRIATIEAPRPNQ
jgi:hypothetical protein